MKIKIVCDNKYFTQGIVITKTSNIPFYIAYDGEIILEQAHSAKTRKIYNYLARELQPLIEYKRAINQQLINTFPKELVLSIITLLTTVNFSKIEPAIEHVIDYAIANVNTWGWQHSDHIPFFINNKRRDLLVRDGTAYWYYVTATQPNAYYRLQKLKRDNFAVHNETNLREKILQKLDDTVIFDNREEAENMKGSIRCSTEDAFRTYTINLLSALWFTITKIVNEFDSVHLLLHRCLYR